MNSSRLFNHFYTVNKTIEIQSGTNYVLSDSLEDALEILRRWDASKVARDFKLRTEIPGGIFSTFDLLTTSLIPVRNQ